MHKPEDARFQRLAALKSLPGKVGNTLRVYGPLGPGHMLSRGVRHLAATS